LLEDTTGPEIVGHYGILVALAKEMFLIEILFVSENGFKRTNLYPGTSELLFKISNAFLMKLISQKNCLKSKCNINQTTGYLTQVLSNQGFRFSSDKKDIPFNSMELLRRTIKRAHTPILNCATRTRMVFIYFHYLNVL
jgi:hypothetical protein